MIKPIQLAHCTGCETHLKHSLAFVAVIRTIMDREDYDIFRAKIDAKLEAFKLQKLATIPMGLVSDAEVNSEKSDSLTKALSKAKAQQLQRSIKQVEGRDLQLKLMAIIDRLWFFQLNVIELADFVNISSRLRLLFIYFQAALTIVINAYNLAMFVLRYSSNAKQQSLSMTMSLIFYGQQILSAEINVLLSVMAFITVYNTIQLTSQTALKFNVYNSDDNLKMRLLQFHSHINSILHKYSVYGLFNLDGSFIIAIISGTMTYIIILMQYDVSFS